MAPHASRPLLWCVVLVVTAAAGDGRAELHHVGWDRLSEPGWLCVSDAGYRGMCEVFLVDIFDIWSTVWCLVVYCFTPELHTGRGTHPLCHHVVQSM